MTIYLIRHGESFGNTSVFLKDDAVDLGLTDKGKKQIIDIDKNYFFKDNRNYIIYSSPYKRALETKEILFGNKHFFIVEEFKELNKGFLLNDFSNKTWDDWKLYFKENFSEISSYSWKYPKGESINDLYERVIPKFTEITSGSNDLDDIFIITHNWVIKVIISYILDTKIGYNNLKIKNLTIIKIEYINGEYSIIL